MIKSFTALDMSAVDSAGGKGASLGEMTRQGIPVPPGFVVLTDAFERFLDETKLREEIRHCLNGVDREQMHTVEHASETIQSLILKAAMPDDLKELIMSSFAELGSEFVAVRSSATAEDSSSAAWAGQLDSFLNTTKDDLLEKVQRCWASLFTPRAIYYRFEQGLHDSHVSVAVVVQKMVNSVKSGIAFSVHPVTEDYNQIIIEAGFGLGEAIVSGQITPDSYVVSKKDDEIIAIDVHEQKKGLFRRADGGNEWRELPHGGEQVLSEEQIIELGHIIKRIENHYGFPCDIEWALEDELSIVQSRPITTLKASMPQKSTQYIRMFEVSGMPYLNTQIFGEHYQPYNIVAVFKDNVWKTFLPIESEKRTLQEGVNLFSDNQKFSEFQNSFTNYQKRARNIFELFVDKKEITPTELEEFFSTVAEFWKYYMKTEFFFVDEAYKQLNGGDSSANLTQLEEVKNSGREFMNDMIFAEDCYLNKALELIAKQTNTSVEDVYWSSKEEVKELLEGKQLASEEIVRRKEAYVVADEHLSGEEAVSWIDNFIVEAEEADLKGIRANPGCVQGKVKIFVYGIDEFKQFSRLVDEMDQGDVLVAETTSPELMPACQKASAIVTNQGGLLSHAAIVSRELDIPCLVGVDGATKKLQDGDVVEVDADNGVVRVVQKNDSTLERVKAIDWHSDWAGEFPRLYLAIAGSCYYNSMKSIFGIDIPFYLTIHKKDQTTCFLPTNEFELFGQEVARKALDKEFLDQWLRSFYAISDEVKEEGAVEPPDYIANFAKIKELHDRYGAYQIATKAAYDSLPVEEDDTRSKLEEARKYSETFYQESAQSIFKLAKYIADQNENYTTKEILSLSELELMHYLDDGTLPDSKELQGRHDANGVLWGKEKQEFLSGEEVSELENFWHSQINPDNLQGKIAYPGKVTGKCRVLIDFKNAEIEEGEILVTEMTDPRFVPLMKKAAAIVTDGGGLLSHAAIVSRELQTPCIVGTKGATKVFESGDLLEVDADNGVVRRLEE